MVVELKLQEIEARASWAKGTLDNISTSCIQDDSAREAIEEVVSASKDLAKAIEALAEYLRKA